MRPPRKLDGLSGLSGIFSSPQDLSRLLFPFAIPYNSTLSGAVNGNPSGSQIGWGDLYQQYLTKGPYNGFPFADTFAAGTTPTYGAAFASFLLTNDGLASPTQNLPTLAAGGSLTAGTPYYWVVTATNADGETTPSAQQTLTPTAGNQTANLSWAQVTGATGYKVYRSTSTGNFASPALAATIASGSTTTYADAGAAASAGNPPGTNSAGAGDGIPEATFYGNGISSGDQFASCMLNPTDTPSVPLLETWITNGASNADLQSLTWPSSGNPTALNYAVGFKNAFITTTLAAVGESRLIPVYTGNAPVGSGSFTIIGFAAVTICGYSGGGSTANITLQPSNMIQPVWPIYNPSSARCNVPLY